MPISIYGWKTEREKQEEMNKAHKINKKEIYRMKQIILILIGLCIVSCQSSIEDKARSLIKKEMESNEIVYVSRDEMEIIVDSAYYPLDSPEYYKQAVDLILFSSGLSDIDREIEEAEEYMALWNNSFSTALSNYEYDKAKKNFEKATIKKEKAIEELQNRMLEMRSELDNHEFIGYKAQYKFRYKDIFGNSGIANYMYYFDKDMKMVTGSYDMDKEYKSVMQLYDCLKVLE